MVFMGSSQNSTCLLYLIVFVSDATEAATPALRRQRESRGYCKDISKEIVVEDSPWFPGWPWFDLKIFKTYQNLPSHLNRKITADLATQDVIGMNSQTCKMCWTGQLGVMMTSLLSASSIFNIMVVINLNISRPCMFHTISLHDNWGGGCLFGYRYDSMTRCLDHFSHKSSSFMAPRHLKSACWVLIFLSSWA